LAVKIAEKLTEKLLGEIKVHACGEKRVRVAPSPPVRLSENNGKFNIFSFRLFIVSK